MNFNEYQSHAARTANPKLNPRERVNQAVYGIVGESGEIVDGMKKVLFHGHDFDRDEMVKECGDLMWYIAEMCSAWGISLDEVAECNVAKLRARYPVAFDEERSRNRVEDAEPYIQQPEPIATVTLTNLGVATRREVMLPDDYYDDELPASAGSH